MVKIIEFACTGNKGRSPVCELGGNGYLIKIGADKEYRAESSGTYVDDIQNDTVPVASMIKIIETGKQRELYSPNELQQIDQAIRDGNDNILKPFYKRAVDIFAREEHKNRAEALKHFGIEGVVKEVGEQTIARPGTVAVLSMAESNNRQVQSIYDSSGYDPVIDVLSRFATGDPDAALPDAFGKGKEEYFGLVEVLLKQVPMAIDRLIN